MSFIWRIKGHLCVGERREGGREITARWKRIGWYMMQMQLLWCVHRKRERERESSFATVASVACGSIRAGQANWNLRLWTSCARERHPLLTSGPLVYNVSITCNLSCLPSIRFQIANCWLQIVGAVYIYIYRWFQWVTILRIVIAHSTYICIRVRCLGAH